LKPDQSKLSLRGECFQDLSEIMTTLRKHDDFSDFDIHCIESKINAWTPIWIALTGREGMPNYTHVLTSGHMIYYLKRWRNVNRFRNQGWENLNASIRYVYHHRSQQGGSSSKKGERTSKTKPSGRWFWLKLYWLTKDMSENNPVTRTGKCLFSFLNLLFNFTSQIYFLILQAKSTF
jgi:hypothetical protein